MISAHSDRSNERSTLRPAYVLVFGFVGGKHACVDMIGVSPLVGLSSRGFTADHAALKAASCKVTKHEKSCIENQHVFILFALDTFGFLAPEAVELLSRVQRVMHSNVMTPRSTDVVFKHHYSKTPEAHYFLFTAFEIERPSKKLDIKVTRYQLICTEYWKSRVLNRKFLTENMKVLAGKIKVLETTLEMEMHPENHTLDSAALLHELYNDM
ncbi:hypothetical protein Tco_1347189 [Tanacetum coccineum]